ncbi:hypothetical protein Tco_1210236 [Tanacetum coccineum]
MRYLVIPQSADTLSSNAFLLKFLFNLAASSGINLFLRSSRFFLSPYVKDLRMEDSSSFQITISSIRIKTAFTLLTHLHSHLAIFFNFSLSIVKGYLSMGCIMLLGLVGISSSSVSLRISPDIKFFILCFVYLEVVRNGSSTLTCPDDGSPDTYASFSDVFWPVLRSTKDQPSIASRFPLPEINPSQDLHRKLDLELAQALPLFILCSLLSLSPTGVAFPSIGTS